MIVVNINKAKEIAHDMRRKARAEEFKPYDEIIMKQIPGTSAVQAEQAREAIREKYAEIQTAINQATDTEELKQALGIE